MALQGPLKTFLALKNSAISTVYRRIPSNLEPGLARNSPAAEAWANRHNKSPLG